MYQERFYRSQVQCKHALEISYNESDLFIASSSPLDKDKTLQIVKRYYHEIESYVNKNPQFLTSLSSLEVDPHAPKIVRDMLSVSKETTIGPFACVAGAIADCVGRELLMESEDIIIENGGDIFVKSSKDMTLGVYLGEHFLVSQKDQTSPIDSIALRLKKRKDAFGVASSSAFIGHSLNFGKADLVTLVACNATVADGFVTAFSNRIKTKKDVEEIIATVQQSESFYGIFIALEGTLYLWGDLELYG